MPADEQGVQCEENAVEEIIRFTEGYPYFLQEFGRHVWNVAEGPTITLQDALDARQVVQLQLDENIFRVRVARCTKAALEYLHAMAALGDAPYRSGDIAAKLGRAGPQNVAPIRSRLIEKGLIFSPSYGLNQFTVPHFADFIRRTAPS